MAEKDLKLMPKVLTGEPHFRWRGGDVSRLEGLSDGVFAFSLTLLVVSLQVPSNFAEMKTAFLHLPSFAISFSLLMLFWYYHFMFHRRYGLEDLKTMVLNALLLFMILFYVYPLKFLFAWLVGSAMDLPGTPDIEPGDIPLLMILYSGGFTAIFLLYSLMYGRAYAKREDLQLNPVEVLLTRSYLMRHLLSMGIGILSLILVIASARLAALSGIIYALMGPIHAVNGIMTRKRLSALLKQSEPTRQLPY